MGNKILTDLLKDITVFSYQFNNTSLFDKYYIEVLSTLELHYLPEAKWLKLVK